MKIVCQPILNRPAPAVLATLGCLASVLSSYSRAAETLPAQPSRIIVGGDHDYEPFEFIDEEGNAAGFNVDLMRAVGKALDIQVEFRLKAWDQSLKALEQGGIDVLHMFGSEERVQLFGLTEPHSILYHIIFVRQGDSGFSGLGDLVGKETIVQRDAYAHELLRGKEYGAKLVPVETEPEAMRLLASGQHDCALVTRTGGRLTILRSELRNITSGSPPLLPCDYCLAVRKGATGLRDRLDEGLRIIKETGRYDEIYDRWLGELAPRHHSLLEVLRKAAWVVAPLAAVAVLALAWMWMLRRRVAARTRDLRQVISERERADAALQATAKLYWRLFEAARDGILILDADTGRVIDANPFLTELMGYSRDHMLGKHLWEIGTFKDIAASKEAFRALQKDEYIRYEDLPLEASDGRRIEVEFVGNAYLVDHARVFQCNIRDLTERKRAEDALRASEARYRSLVDNAPSMILTLDRGGTILSINRTVAGLAPQDVIGKPHLDYVAPEDRDAVGKVIETVMVTSEPAVYRTRGAGPAGDGSWYETSVGPLLQDGEVVGATLIVTDITERLSLESQLRQAQKLESIGQLAGGVAHDFNNMLSAIIGYTDLLLMDANEGDPIRDDLMSIRKSADRAAGLTRQLLAFSRKQTLQPRVLNLNDVVADLENMLRRLIGEDVELATVPGSDLGQVKADPGQIEQVIMNLAVNARDAMPDGGRLTIETANVELEEDYALSHVSAEPGPHVMVAVTDSGTGMDEATKERIFEPFFTTKERDKGTGLGLSTVYGIVKQSGGNIWVYSEPGRGTTFKVYLPRVDEPAEKLSRTGPARAPAGGTETVLVVEDEREVRDLVARVLRLGGYTVLEAADGEEALKAAGEHRGDIQLVITDVIMPRMSAKELAERIAQDRPGTKVLFTSGYTDNSVAHHGVLDPGIPFIQKPYTVSILLAKVREVLEAPAADAG